MKTTWEFGFGDDPSAWNDSTEIETIHVKSEDRTYVWIRTEEGSGYMKQSTSVWIPVSVLAEVLRRAGNQAAKDLHEKTCGPECPKHRGGDCDAALQSSTSK